MVEDNEKLIYAFLARKGLDVDEWYGDCAIGLVKAAKSYNPHQKSTFATFAFACMLHEICHCYVISRAKKRIPNYLCKSLDSPLPEELDELTIGDTVECKENLQDYDGAFDLQDALKRAEKRLSPKTKDAIHLYMVGYSTGDIARMRKVTASAVWSKLSKARKVISEEMKKSASVTAITNAEKP